MKFPLRIFYIYFLLLVTNGITLSQHKNDLEADKCGYDPEKEAALYEHYGKHWGYSYDSLLNDIVQWETSDFIQIQSIGQSTLGKEIYELTISDFDETKNFKHRIYIHARTHPAEIQSFHVTNEIINYLSNDTEIGTFLREHCIFHIIPMFNPDGVELEYPRENANGIDLESNWDAENPEIEVINLRNRLQDLMFEENPIEIALNMHSAYVCKRYFVYHHENGTSPLYTELEEEYIEGTRDHFLTGIEPYNYYVSWTNGTPDQYPESWWWMNFQEQVMALTYEDMNCEAAGFFQKTAYASLYGISDYLGLGYVGIPADLSTIPLQIKAYPNPFKDEINFEWNNFDHAKFAFITDIFGKHIRTFSSQEIQNNHVKWDGKNNVGNDVTDGVYLLNLTTKNLFKSIKLIKQ
ncbi:M14 family zinc carboxypeptidase [Bacteroidota bacterium]